MGISMQKNHLIPSRDIEDQSIIQSGWLRDWFSCFHRNITNAEIFILGVQKYTSMDYTFSKGQKKLIWSNFWAFSPK